MIQFHTTEIPGALAASLLVESEGMQGPFGCLVVTERPDLTSPRVILAVQASSDIATDAATLESTHSLVVAPGTLSVQLKQLWCLVCDSLASAQRVAATLHIGQEERTILAGDSRPLPSSEAHKRVRSARRPQPPTLEW